MKLVVICLLALAAAPLPLASAESEPGPNSAAIVHFRAAAIAAQEEDCGKALKEISPVVDGKPDKMPDKLLAAAYDLAIVCNARANRNEKAAQYARRATALTEASDMAWTMRFFADYIGKRYPQAVETAEAMTQGRGAALNGLDPRWMWGLHRSLDQANLAALDKRLLTVMAASSYDPADPSFTIDDGRGSAQALLAGRLLAEGDRAGALAMMAGLTSVSAITEVLFNPDLRTASQPAPNLRAAAEADLRRSRDLKNRYPDSLRLIIAEANTLRQLGRPSDAIVVLEAARGRINSKRPFADQGETLPWWWNELGYANSMAGNYEGMTASFASGSAVSESGMPNVSQVINLGSQQIAFARYDDALRTVSAEFLKREMSPYGKMQALSVRGCALALSGEANEAQALLREVTAHESDDPATVTDLRLCLGDDVGAAASLVRRLSHAALRANALKELAHYADPIAGQPSDPRQVRRAKVAQRAEVQQALAAAGGVVDIPLQRNALGW